MSKQLNEINILRPIIIVLLVFYHSFIIYSNGWPKVEGIDDFVVYQWIAKISYACMLETFTFVSGYLFGHAIYNGKKYTFNELLKKKFKRLIIPSIVFTILYSFLFYDKAYFSFEYVYDIFNGLGHMWYLPMLFWCFLAAYAILNIRIRESYKLTFLFFLSIFSFIPLPFRMQSSCYYLFFFYLGIFVYNKNMKLEVKCKSLLLFGLSTILIFVTLTLIQKKIYEIQALNLFQKAFNLSLLNLTKITYATLGLFFLYFISKKISSICIISSNLIEINKLCFGVYLIQQFLLKIFYYKTSLPLACGTYLLPWVGFVITLLLSFILASILKRTRFGNSLI